MNKQLLEQVMLDNIRDNQIGGETDGIPQEVARDLGYNDFTETELQVITEQHGGDVERIKKVGSAFCGECAIVIPCQHANGKNTFGN